jgi:hypothetical protein
MNGKQHGPTRPHFHYLGVGTTRDECTSRLCWLVIHTGLVYFKK